MYGFTLIKGFDNIVDLRIAMHTKFPQIDKEEWDIYKLQDMYYAVTMCGKTIQIVISKEYIRYRILGKSGCVPTDEFKSFDFEWFGIYGDCSRWNEGIILIGSDYIGNAIQEYSGEKTGGPRRKHWSNNTKVLLYCLFANKTRFDDDATY